MARFDVVVLGAGPVGSYTAYRLSEQGFSVLLVDRKELPGKEVCSGVIGSEAFERYPLPLSTVRATISAIRLHSPSLRKSVSYASRDMAKVVDRKAFDVEMVALAVSKGTEFMGGVRLESVDIGEKGVFLKLGKESIRCEVLVVSSGYSPVILKKLGFSSYGEVFEGSQVEAEALEARLTEVFLGERFRGGFGWLIPFGDGSSKVGVVSKGKSREVLRGFLEDLRRMGVVSSWDGVKTAPIPSCPIERTVSDRVLVVGEAAGQVKGTTFGGIYYGLIAADFCVDAVGKAFKKGNFSRDVLKAYESSWRDRLLGEMRIGRVFRERLFSNDGLLELVIDKVSSSKILSVVTTLLRFDWHGPVIKFLFERGVFGEILSCGSSRGKRDEAMA